MPVGRLHVLTDYVFQQRHSHAQLAEFALQGGADTIQFRHKEGDTRHRLHELQRTAAATAPRRVPLIVNDHIELAMAVGAAGVHLGQRDLPVAIARAILGRAATIGVTASTADEARRAEAEGADYIGFGPVFATSSKRSPGRVRGLEGLEETCRAVSLPVIAIAGITHKRVRQVLDAGAHGVAVMTAISTAPDPSAATRHFAEALSL